MVQLAVDVLVVVLLVAALINIDVLDRRVRRLDQRLTPHFLTGTETEALRAYRTLVASAGGDTEAATEQFIRRGFIP